MLGREPRIVHAITPRPTGGFLLPPGRMLSPKRTRDPLRVTCLLTGPANKAARFNSWDRHHFQALTAFEQSVGNERSHMRFLVTLTNGNEYIWYVDPQDLGEWLNNVRQNPNVERVDPV